jgi:hypothetical protein
MENFIPKESAMLAVNKKKYGELANIFNSDANHGF